MQEAKDPKTIAATAVPLSENGANQHTREEGFNIVKPSIVGGNSASYLTARIARDCPEVLEEMKRVTYRTYGNVCKPGKYPSVRAAARASRSFMSSRL